MSRNPSIAEVLNDATEAARDDVLTWLPATVTRYDAATQQVDAQPIQKARHYDEDGVAVVEARPVVTGVPVAFPGGGGLTVTFPIAVGDVVVLLYSGVSVDKWLRSGSDSPQDPEFHGRHSGADAVAIPCIQAFSRPRASAPTDHVRLGTDGAAAQGAALGETLDSFAIGVSPTTLKGFLSAVAAYVNGIAPGTLPIGGPTFPATFASDTVKVTP